MTNLIDFLRATSPRLRDAWVHPLGWTDPCSTPEEALAQLREEPALGGGW